MWLADWQFVLPSNWTGVPNKVSFINIYKTHLLTVKHSLFSSSVLLLHVHTRYNLFAHPSCTSLFILLFIKSKYTVFAHLICFALFYSIAHFTLYLSFFTYIYILYALVLKIKISKKNGRQKSFWRKSTAVQNMKRQCRKAERMWWKTKLEIHYSIYKDSLHAFNLELATARQIFFSNLINSNLNNTRTLFATVERLTNPPSQIPSEMLSDSKCNKFASFFSEKISNIRKEIGTYSCNTEVTQIRQQSQKRSDYVCF